MKYLILLFSLLWSVLAIGQSLSNDLVFSFPLDGNARDMSGYNRNGTIYGGVTPTTDRFGKSGGACAFNGSTGFIDIASFPTIGTGDFTISYWAYYNPSTAYALVFSKDRCGDGTTQYRYGELTDNGLFSSFSNSGGGSSDINFTLSKDSWSHYVFVRSGTKSTLYVDGVLKTSSTATAVINVDNGPAYHYRIGARYSCSANGITDMTNLQGYLNGSVDDLRMYSRALTANEVSDLYNEKDLMASFSFDGGKITDESSNKWAVSCSPGTRAAADRFGRANSAIEFYGGKSRITIDSAKTIAAFNILPFSTSFWFNSADATGTTSLINKYYSSSNDGFGLFLYENQLVPYYFRNGSNAVYNSNNAMVPVSLNTWYHCALTIDAVSGAKVYLNGELKLTIPWTGTPGVPAGTANNAKQPLRFGCYPSTGSSDRSFIGRMDDIKVYGRTLSPQEISASYIQEGGSTMSGLIAYYPFDGNANDVSGKGLNGTVGAGASLAPDRFGKSNSAYLINTALGTGAISIPKFGAVASKEEITVSLWVKTDADCPNGSVFVMSNNVYTNRLNFHLRWVSSPYQYIYWDFGDCNGAGRLPSIYPPASGFNPLPFDPSTDFNKWVHYAVVVRKGATAAENTMEVYRKGVLVLSKKTSSTFTPASADTLFFGNGYKGTLDDIRIYDHALKPNEIANLADLNGLAFDGTQQTTAYGGGGTITTATIPNPFTTSNVFTAEMWVKPTSTPVGVFQGFFGANTFLDVRPVPALYIYEDKLQVDLNPNNASTTQTTGFISGFFSPNQWTHVAMVSDGSTCFIYKNGELKYTCPFVSSMASATSPSVIFLGANGGKFIGQMDEVRVWSVARTQEQIRAAMYQEFTMTQPGLSASYSFNGSMVNVVNGVSGTLNPVAGTTPATYTTSNALRTPTMLPFSAISSTSVTANWNAISGAASYEVQYANNAGLSLPKAINSITGTSTVITASDTAVFAQVRAIFPSGETTAWSTMVSVSRFAAPGKAIDLTQASSQYVQVPKGTWFKGDFTVDAWVKLKTDDSYFRLFDFGGGTPSNNVLFAVSNTSNSSLPLSVYSGTSPSTVYPTAKILKDVWTHVAITVKDGQASFYFNGVDVTNPAARTVNIPLGVETINNYIGKSNWPEATANAQFDEFRIYSKALSLDTIIARSHRHLTGNEDGLKLYYDFDNINGTAVPDLSAGKRDGVLANIDATKGGLPIYVASKALLTPFIRSTSAVTTTGFTANWDAVPSATSYDVETRSNDTWTKVASSITNSYKLTGANPTTYRVRAVTATQTSEYSSASDYVAPGNAINFAGGVCSVPYDTAYNTKKFTISFWAKPNAALTAYQCPIGSRYAYGSTLTGYNFYVMPSNTTDTAKQSRWNFFAGNTPTSNTFFELYGPKVKFGVWSHVAVSYDGTTAKMFVNGVKVDEKVTPFFPNTSSATFFGRLNAAEWPYNGSLDEVSFWNKALDSTQIRALSHYSYDMRTPKDGLLAYFDFNQSTLGTLTNEVGNKVITTTQIGTATSFVPSKALLTPFTRSATVITATSLTANWDSVPGATSYSVKFVKQGASDTTTKSATTTKLVLDNLLDGTTYLYKVQAIAPNQISEWTSLASVTTPMVPPGNAIDLTQISSQYVSVPKGKWFSSEFTVDAWVKLKSKNSYFRLFDFGNGAPSNNVLFAATNSGYNALPLSVYNGTAGTPIYTTAAIPVGVWTHVAITVKEGQASFYFNGIDVTNPNGRTVNNPSGVETANNFIGKSNWNDGNADAQYDEFRIYSKALTQAEIIARSHKHLTGTEDSLKLYYDFDQISGTTVPNLARKTGSAGNGTVVAATFATSKALITPFTRKVTDTTTTGFTAHWDKVPGATKYELQYRDITQAAFTSKIVTDTAYKISGSISGAQYLYTVQATTPTRTSDWTTLDTVQCKVAHVGNALNIDNATAYPTNPAPKYLQIPSFAVANKFTIEGWYYLTANNGNYMRLFEFANAGPSNNILFYLDPNNYAGIHLYPGTTPNIINVPVKMPTQQWTHVALVIDDLVAAVYYNGVKVASRTLTGNFNTKARTTNYLGKSMWADPYSNILVDEFRIYSTALTESQLSDRAFRQLTTAECTEPTLVAYYDFDKVVSNNIVTNLASTSTALNATIVGGAGYVPSKAQLTPFVSTSSTDSKITLSWKVIPNATYTVRQATNAAFTGKTETTQPTNAPITLTNLAPNTSYWFAVQAKVGSDTSAWITTSARTLSLTDSLIAYYPFNSSAVDASGHGADGTLSSTTAVTVAPDRFGNSNQAYKFNNGSIKVDGSKNNLDGSFTVAAWVNSTDNTSVAVVSKYTYPTSKFDGYMLAITDGPSRNLSFETTSDPRIIQSSGKEIQQNVWSFVCARYSSDSTLTFWVNGDSVKSISKVKPNVANAYPFYIGAFTGGNGQFIGSIDDIRLYRRPLSKKEISSLYHENGWPYIGVKLDNNKLTEQQAKGTVVGNLAPLTGASLTNESITYTLVAGAGSTDNAKFSIDGAVLKSAAIFDTTAQTTASVRVRATTASGVIVESPLTIQIVGAVTTNVYTFNDVNVLTTDAWTATGMNVTATSGKDGSNALTASTSAMASNTLFKLFGTTIADDVNLQYSFGYDISSSADGTSFGITTDAKDTAFTFVSKASGASSFRLLGQNVAASAIPAGWARVEVLVSMLDNVTAQISVRARSLATATSTWTTIVSPKTVTIDNSASNTAVSNLTLWKNLFVKNGTSACVVDNLSLSVRTLNANFTTLNDGLIAFYNMDNNMRDTSGSGNHGTQTALVTKPTPTANRFNQANSAYYFDGASNFSVAGISKKLPATNVSFSVWAKQESMQQSSIFAGSTSTQRVNVHLCWFDNAMYWDYGTLAADKGRLSKQAPSSASWKHYVFVSGEHGMKIYVNNVLFAEKSDTSHFTAENITMFIGSSLQNANFFTGSMDDLRIYNRELASDEVSRLYYDGGWPVQQIAASNVSVKTGATVKLPISVTPEDAPTKGLLYSSKNTSIATVDSRGVVTGVKVGSAIISVSTANGLVTAEAVVSVVSNIVDITNINLLDSAITLIKGDTRILKYTTTPTKDVFLSNISWESKNTYSVPVLEGTITAKDICKNALVYLYADSTKKTVKDSCYVTVLPSAIPTLTADTTQHYSLRAVDPKGVNTERDTLKIEVSLFFQDAEDSLLTYSCSPQSASTDTMQWYLNNGVLYIYQWAKDTAQILPASLTLTASDSDKQTVSKKIYVQMKMVPDLKPVVLPAQFDALYQFRRTATLDLRKYVSDDFTPFNSLIFDSLTVSKDDSLTLSIKNGILTLNTKRVNDGTGFVALRATDSRNQWSEIKIGFAYKYVTNSAPQFAAIDPLWQKTADGLKGIVRLSSYVSDDYTPISKLKWTITPPKNVNYSLVGDVLTLTASSTAWSGTENVTITAYDEASKPGVFVIPFTQTISERVSGTPEVDYELFLEDGKMPLPSVIAKGTKVKAIYKTIGTIGADSWNWSFPGSSQIDIAGGNEVTVSYDSIGVFGITLSATNNTGTTVVTHKAINVIGLVATKTNICKDSSVVLSSSDITAGNQYTWSTKETGVNAITVSPTTATTYKVTITPKGSSTTIIDSIRISVALPVTNIVNDTAICSGTKLSVSPTGFKSIWWNGSKVAEPSITFTPRKDTTISVTAVSDAACPLVSDKLKVSIKAVPDVQLPSHITLCDGTKDTIVAKGGKDKNSYKWNKSTVLSDSLVVYEAGTFIVSVTGANGCEASDTTVVTTAKKSEVVAKSSETTVCEKGLVKLTATSVDSIVSYKWNTTLGADSLVRVVAVGNNDYYVTATNLLGCQSTASVRVIAETQVPLNITPTPNDTICAGMAVNIAASGSTDYVWSDNSGYTSSIGVSPTASKTYRVTATKGSCKQIDTVRITVLTPATLSIAVSKNDTLCKGDSLQLTASGCKTYSWNGTIENGKKFAPLQSARFVVTATDAKGCQIIDGVNIVVNELTTLKAVANDSSICLGDSICLYGRGAKSYTWDAPIVDSAKFKPSKTAIYTVTGVDTNSCKATATVEVTVNALPTIQIVKQDSVCKGATAVLTATGTAKTYVWSDAVVNGVSFIPADSKLYKVTATTDNGCVDTSSMQVNVKTSAAAGTLTLASRNVTLCKGDSLQLNGAGVFDSIIWNENIDNNSWVIPFTDSVFTVKATDAKKCVITDAVKVTVNSRPAVTAHASKLVTCQGRSIKLWATATETANYSWSETLSASDSSFVMNALGEKTFIVTATNDKQCSDTAKVKVTVNAAVSVDLKAITDTICAGDSVLLDAKGTFAKATWSTGTANGKYIKPTQNTQYNVVVTDNVACESKDSIQVIVHALPNVTANRDTTVCAGRSIILAAKGATKYTWNNAAVDGVAKTITDNTTFTVTGTDANKCSNTAVVKVSVLKPYKEQLGVVTIDSSKSEKVIIAWNRHKTQRTERYILYRENGATWDSIAGRTITEASYVFDPNVSLKTQAYKYKLVTIDSTCHNRVESTPHRTMHVFTTKSGTDNSITVNWNAYEGLDLTEYIAYRVFNGTLTEIGKDSKGSAEYHITDTNPVNGATYRVFYKLPESVNPSVLKSDSGPFSQSFSNMSEASLVSVNSFDADGVSVWPVPTKDIIHVELANNQGAHIVLFDDNGKQVAQTILVNDAAEIATESLSSGLYLLQVHTNAGLISKKITIVK